MDNLQKTRFIAANYSNLQGLKAVPLGMLLIVTVLWANAQTGRASDLTLPILFSAVTILISWIIYRYYRTRFGRVERTAQQKKMELVIGIVGGIVALAGFIVDTKFHLPLSLIGLIFTAAVVAEYLRMQWYARGNDLLPLMLFAGGILLFTSLMPLFGLDHWWQWLGLRYQMLGVLVVAGAVITVYGLLGHLYFVRHLPKGEAFS